MTPRWARLGRVLVLATGLLGLAGPARADVYYVIVGGLGGEERYAREFEQVVDLLATAVSETAGDPGRVLRLTGAQATRAAVKASLEGLARALDRDDTLAVFLIGHGSYDGVEYKLNLPGPDLTASALAELLGALPPRAQLVVNATSASGASLEALRAEGRVVMTATRSGGESNATVFGGYWARALGDPRTDLDRDGWISAAEAFEVTQAGVKEHYAREVMLATEHARLDGGDGKTFRLVRLASGGEPAEGRRGALLAAIESLRARKGGMPTEIYYRLLEELLVPLAELETGARRPEDAGGSSGPAPSLPARDMSE